jgi:starvation-inducible DNA-binding protein
VKPEIGIEDTDRQGVVDILNRVLADEYVLYTKSRNYHWNVVGIHFQPLHTLFQSQYEELDEIIDDVAERARSLGGRAAGSMAEFLQLTRLQEAPPKIVPAEVMLSDLTEDHERIIRGLRVSLEMSHEKYNDAGTSDFLTGLMERHEKMAWMLRAHLSSPEAEGL